MTGCGGDEKNIYPRRISKTLLFSHNIGWAIPAHFTNYSVNKLHLPPVIEMRQIRCTFSHFILFINSRGGRKLHLSEMRPPMGPLSFPGWQKWKRNCRITADKRQPKYTEQNLLLCNCVLHKFTCDRNSASAVKRLPLPVWTTTKTIKIVT